MEVGQLTSLLHNQGARLGQEELLAMFGHMDKEKMIGFDQLLRAVVGH